MCVYGNVGMLRRGSTFAAALLLGVLAIAPAASGDQSPYDLPAKLPAPVSSPSWDSAAPFTPTVVSLLKQLEPAQPDPVHDTTAAPATTVDQLTNAAKLLHGVGLPNPDC